MERCSVMKKYIEDYRRKYSDSLWRLYGQAGCCLYHANRKLTRKEENNG